MKKNTKTEITTNTGGGILVNNNSKKYGLLTAISLVVGIIIGGGIFLKNAGVVAQTQSVTWTLVAWLVGGFGITCAALAFMEVISSESKDSNNGIVGWADKIVGKKMGNLFAWFFLIIYVCAIYTTLAFFAAGFTFSALGYANPKWYYLLFLSAGYLTYFLLINGIFNKPGQIFQLFLTIFKLIPLIMIIFFGIFGKTASHIFEPITSGGTALKSNGFSGMILALPGVLFAFDGFYYVANVKKDIKNPDKNLAKAILIGIVFTVIFYALISVAIFSIDNPFGHDIKHGGGTADTFAHFTFSPWFAKFIDYTIIIATLVGLNGYTIVGTRLLRNCSARFKLPFAKLLAKESKAGASLGASIYALILSLLYLVISAIIGVYFYNKKAPTAGFGDIINFLSNWQTVIVLILISVIFIFTIINRITKKVDLKKQWYFIPTAIVSIIFFIGLPIYDIYHTIHQGWYLTNDGSDNIKTTIHNSRILIYILISIMAITVIGFFIPNAKSKTVSK